jgi:YD repeat-containing protein
MRKLTGPMCLLVLAALAPAQGTVTVRPKEIEDVLVNPGIGFMTFQRFNGDKLNEGLKWTEGYPIEYQELKSSIENENHPATSIAYFRIYWKFIEPEQGQYRWDLLDTALKTARSRGQTLMLRIAPYGTGAAQDVPDWYRVMLGDETGKLRLEKWRTDPEDPRYVRHFGAMIRALGARYDGNPDLESVDMAMHAGALERTFGYETGTGNLLTRTETDTTTNTVPYSTNGTTRTWTNAWANFLLASVTGPRTDLTQTTQFGYDGGGALTSITDALGHVTSITAHTGGVSMASCQIGLNAVVFEVLIPLPGCAISSSYSFI